MSQDEERKRSTVSAQSGNLEIATSSSRCSLKGLKCPFIPALCKYPAVTKCTPLNWCCEFVENIKCSYLSTTRSACLVWALMIASSIKFPLPAINTKTYQWHAPSSTHITILNLIIMYLTSTRRLDTRKKVSLIVLDKHYVDPSRHCLPTDAKERRNEKMLKPRRKCVAFHIAVSTAVDFIESFDTGAFF